MKAYWHSQKKISSSNGVERNDSSSATTVSSSVIFAAAKINTFSYARAFGTGKGDPGETEGANGYLFPFIYHAKAYISVFLALKCWRTEDMRTCILRGCVCVCVCVMSLLAQQRLLNFSAFDIYLIYLTHIWYTMLCYGTYFLSARID